MFDRFTDRARKVISFARQEAVALNHDYIGTEHILLGLVREGSGVAANVLENLDVDLEIVRLKVEKLVKPAPDVVTTGQLPFTPRAKKVLEFAIDEARGLGHNYLGTEHLLLGLLREKEGLAAHVLLNLGLNLDGVRQEVMEFLGAEKAPAESTQTPEAPTPSPPPYSVSRHLETLLVRQDLSRESAAELMAALIFGRLAGASIAAVAIALRAKGESVEELAAFASVMRAHAVAVEAPDDALDTCGTGGDKSATFNISTAAAFVAAGMGIPVAKHGGRAVSSGSGSADVLKELGVMIELSPKRIARCLKEAGIGFMFAPKHHPGMMHAAPVRKELGVRTVFNLLGPLSNPAGAKLSLLGVFEPSLCEKFAQVLKLLGSRSAMIVCGTGPGGSGYLDEVSTFGPTTIARLRDGAVTVEQVDAQKLGLSVPPPDVLHAASAVDSALLITAVLGGHKGPARDIVVLNAAAAALVAGKATDWPEALAAAERSIDEGRAEAALKKLVEVSNAA
ncbi:MAG: anthranilate phosphoribosyltransferase [Planctomycetota bacterium]|nr:anthranilate phosphoribosyltransferase [Planctomycetota bacterium]